MNTLRKRWFWCSVKEDGTTDKLKGFKLDEGFITRSQAEHFMMGEGGDEFQGYDLQLIEQIYIPIKF